MNQKQDNNDLILQMGQRIQKICHSQGISYQELANKSNISTAALYRIISGNANPQLSTLQLLAEALSISLVELLGGQAMVPDQEISEQKILECIERLSDQKKRLLWDFLLALEEQ